MQSCHLTFYFREYKHLRWNLPPTPLQKWIPPGLQQHRGESIFSLLLCSEGSKATLLLLRFFRIDNSVAFLAGWLQAVFCTPLEKPKGLSYKAMWCVPAFPPGASTRNSVVICFKASSTSNHVNYHSLITATPAFSGSIPPHTGFKKFKSWLWL